MADKYANYETLSAVEVLGTDYEINHKEVKNAKSIIFTPHGGSIEAGTSELVKEVAKGFHNWYEFAGIKSSGNTDLHITSTNFDEPIALNLIGQATHAMSLHGYGDSVNAHTEVGGLDAELRDIVIQELTKEGFSASTANASGGIAGLEPENISNRTSRGKGVQLELSTLQRRQFFTNDDFSSSNRKNTTDTFKRYVKALRRAMNKSTAHFPFSYVKGGEQTENLSSAIGNLKKRMDELINIKYFGAKGDGVTDDTTAIQSAIDYANSIGGGVVYIPSGKYKVVALLNMKSNVVLKGDGRTSIIYKDSYTSMQSIIYAIGIEKFGYMDFAIETTLSGNSLYCKGTNYSFVDNVYIQTNLGAGLTYRESNHVVVTRLHTKGTGKSHGLTIGTETAGTGSGGCDDFIIDNCIFEDYGTTDGGMAMDISGGWDASNNIYVCKNIIISNCILKNGVNNGLKIQIVEDVTFSNNIIDTAGAVGLILNTQSRKMDRVIISNNNIKNCDYGISQLDKLSTGNDVLISENKIFNCRIGVFFNSVLRGNADILGNTIEATESAIEITNVADGMAKITIKNNPRIKGQTAIKGTAYNTYIDNNVLSGTFRELHDESGELFPLEMLWVKNNVFDGASASTPFYTRKRTINNLVVGGNTFKNKKSAISSIYIRRPVDETQAFTIKNLIIDDNHIFADPTLSTSNAIQVDTAFTIEKGRITRNFVNKVGGTAIVAPASVTIEGNMV